MSTVSTIPLIDIPYITVSFIQGIDIKNEERDKHIFTTYATATMCLDKSWNESIPDTYDKSKLLYYANTLSAFAGTIDIWSVTMNPDACKSIIGNVVSYLNASRDHDSCQFICMIHAYITDYMLPFISTDDDEDTLVIVTSYILALTEFWSSFTTLSNDPKTVKYMDELHANINLIGDPRLIRCPKN
jgi:hypothetical protein